ncbi:hypothetical protein BDB01DRAFT_45601 [Pilobolus umbonatus]|nr:hypothetical protein BDB01DRAFT_45601 [Pilobolus umbonatus]
MVICKFFQNGSCKFGNKCNFEHVKSQPWPTGNTTTAATNAKYNESSIKSNLSTERPQWQLSVYGPAKEEPNLIVGTDRSCEEDRYLYYTSMRTTGNESQYLAATEVLNQQFMNQVNAIINDPQGAIQHYHKGKAAGAGSFGNNMNSTQTPFTGTGFLSNPYSQTTSTSNSFSSLTTSKPSAFGGSAFGFTSTLGSGSAFGQSNTMGGGTVFGQSAMGGGSTFGQSNTLGGGSTFGQSSTLGGGSSFGQSSAMGSGSAFGQSSALGGGSAFGQSSTLGGGSSFGQPSAMGSGSAFGQPML